MGIHIHVHMHQVDEDILKEIKSINHKLETMGQKFDEIQTLLTGINESTTNIAADLERLAEQINGGLSSDEAVNVINSLQAAADQLKTIAAINPEPTTPEA